MPRKARGGRIGLVTVVEHRYELTDVGLATVREMAAIGSEPSEIDQYLQVSKGWTKSKIDDESEWFDADIAEAFEEGLSEFKGRIRVAQVNLGEVNAAMAIHLGKQYLGQKEQAVEHNHTLRVIGTLPDFNSKSADDWQRQFVPESARAIAKQQAIDAVCEEVHAPRKDTSGGD